MLRVNVVRSGAARLRLDVPHRHGSNYNHSIDYRSRSRDGVQANPIRSEAVIGFTINAAAGEHSASGDGIRPRALGWGVASRIGRADDPSHLDRACVVGAPVRELGGARPVPLQSVLISPRQSPPFVRENQGHQPERTRGFSRNPTIARLTGARPGETFSRVKTERRADEVDPVAPVLGHLEVPRTRPRSSRRFTNSASICEAHQPTATGNDVVRD